MPNIFRYITAALLATGAVQALPKGAPKCAINPAVITKGHEVAPSAVGYAIQASSQTYAPGQSLTVTIGGQKNWQGILMYATPGTQDDAKLAPNNIKQHVGVFTLPAGFRAQSAAPCQAGRRLI